METKRLKIECRVREAFRARFLSKSSGTRNIILRKPLFGKVFQTYGAVKLFTYLGFGSFIVDLPKVCYPELVREFYVNLYVKKERYISFVGGIKIQLIAVMLGSILDIENPSKLSIFNKRGPKDLEFFFALD